MTRSEDDAGVVAEQPGIECPLCNREIDGILADHLSSDHSQQALVKLVVSYVYEREESELTR